jgi:gas vesicle protein
MSEDEKTYRRRRGGVFPGFLIGGLIGATVALLTAPQSGAQTRKELREKGMEIRDMAMETADQKRQQAEEAISQARTKVTEVSRNARMRAADMMHREARTLESSVPLETRMTDTSEMSEDL